MDLRNGFDIKRYIRTIPDYPKPGIMFRDITTLLSNLHAFRAAVDELPEGPREAFLMFRFEGLRVAKIAQISGAPLKTVETRIRRATLLLAERLGALRQHLPTS